MYTLLAYFVWSKKWLVECKSPVNWQPWTSYLYPPVHDVTPKPY